MQNRVIRLLILARTPTGNSSKEVFFFFFEKDQRKLIRLDYEELYHGLDLIKQVNHGNQKNQIP